MCLSKTCHVAKQYDFGKHMQNFFSVKDLILYTLRP